MAILLIGGTGKTGVRMIPFLQSANIPFLIASRKGVAPSGLPATKFDWLDASTFSLPFEHKFPNNEKISAIYLIAPEIPDPVPSMNAFIDLAAKEYGVKRFVLLTGTTVEKGGYNTGMVWSHLDDIGVEYCILRATWFMENFSEGHHRGTIKNEGKIYSACADGKMPFVSATDIAEVAFRNLTGAKILETNYTVLGPELLTHDEVATKFSIGLGRGIIHVRLSEAERTSLCLKLGMPQPHAKFITFLELQSAKGMEQTTNDVVQKVTGRAPLTFDAWIQENRKAWDQNSNAA